MACVDDAAQLQRPWFRFISIGLSCLIEPIMTRRQLTISTSRTRQMTGQQPPAARRPSPAPERHGVVLLLLLLDGTGAHSLASIDRSIDRRLNRTAQRRRPMLIHSNTQPQPQKKKPGGGGGGAPLYTPLRQHAAASDDDNGGGAGMPAPGGAGTGGRQSPSFKPFGVRRDLPPPPAQPSAGMNGSSGTSTSTSSGGSGGSGGKKPPGRGEEGPGGPSRLEEGGGQEEGVEEGPLLPFPPVASAVPTNQAPLWSCVAVLCNNMMGAGGLVDHHHHQASSRNHSDDSRLAGSSSIHACTPIHPYGDTPRRHARPPLRSRADRLARGGAPPRRLLHPEVGRQVFLFVHRPQVPSI